MPQKKRPAAYWMRRARWGIGPCGHSLLFVLRFGQRLFGPVGLVGPTGNTRFTCFTPECRLNNGPHAFMQNTFIGFHDVLLSFRKLVCGCGLLYSNAKLGQNHQQSNRSFCNNQCIGKSWR